MRARVPGRGDVLRVPAAPAWSDTLRLARTLPWRPVRRRRRADAGRCLPLDDLTVRPGQACRSPDRPRPSPGMARHHDIPRARQVTATSFTVGCASPLISASARRTSAR